MAEGRSWLKWVGLGCAGLVVLVVIFVAVLFLVVRTLTSEPEQVVREFLEATAAGDYARAHDCFSAPLKQAQPLEAFTAAVQASPGLFDVSDTSFTERSVDLTGARLAGTVTTRAGTVLPASFTLVKENDAWKLNAYTIGSTP